MGRINIELSEELHKKLKVVCALKGITIRDYIVSALESELSKTNLEVLHGKK